ncbi:MAG: hypothetical protein GY796_18635 [Chloroflexi bacterium]|nr:hypothetical protein [Chloroflexota bacterium]
MMAVKQYGNIFGREPQKKKRHTKVFPETEMYVVTGNSRTQPSFPRFGDIFFRQNKDYIMPRDFNQLMFDAGYQLSADNLQELMHALIVVALPTRINMQPIECDPINNIDLIRGPAEQSRIVSRISYSHHRIFLFFSDDTNSAWDIFVHDRGG